DLDHLSQSGSYTGLFPAVAKIAKRFTVTVKHVRAEQSRGLARNGRDLGLFPLALNRFKQFAGQGDRSRPLVLRRIAFNPYLLCRKVDLIPPKTDDFTSAPPGEIYKRHN